MNKIILVSKKRRALASVLLFIICLISGINIKAQNVQPELLDTNQNVQPLQNPKGCGEYVIDNAALTQALKYESSHQNMDVVTVFTIRVYFHICRDNGGMNAAATEEEVKAEFNELIADFAPNNICFISMGLDYIDNTIVNNSPTSSLLTPYLKADCLNIFYHFNIPGFGGYAWSIPNTFCSIAKSNLAAAHTTSHEVGHCFGLLHTFEPGNGNEMINGSNSSTSADLITDTPADPWAYKGQACYSTSGCLYTGNCTDPNGASNFTPPYTNTMSYWRGAPCYPNFIFTSGQYSRVNSFLFTNGPLINCQSLSNYSQGAVTWSSGNYWRTAINTVTVSGNVNITGAAVATFGGNLVVVQNNFVATPTGNGLVLIRPSACSGGEGIPRTNLQADLLSEDALLIFPNPANEFITIKTTNTDSNTIISIYTSTMQLIKTVNFEAGIENIVSTINFSPGIYFIDVQSGDQSYQTKFVVSR
ncbi:MAG: T9SS type A sorting domain-containing protein [Bacteroidetes bacterium]|nr:T9SS type A sorting domain-containing protein [Bacteroidota bacterium]